MNRGFTLIELMVVIAVIIILMTVFLGGHRGCEYDPEMVCTWKVDRGLCLCQVIGDDDWQIAPDHACDQEDGR